MEECAFYAGCNVDCAHYTWDGRTEPDSHPRVRPNGPGRAIVTREGSFLGFKGRPFERRRPKVGRNDPCPCGSRLKYKRCCGR
jgi:hypothetical protein